MVSEMSAGGLDDRGKEEVLSRGKNVDLLVYNNIGQEAGKPHYEGKKHGHPRFNEQG